jgi:hypothetical protein
MRKKKIYLSQVGIHTGYLVKGLLDGNLRSIEPLLIKKLGRGNLSLIGHLFEVLSNYSIPRQPALGFNEIEPKRLLDLVNQTAMANIPLSEVDISSATINGSGYLLFKPSSTSTFTGSRTLSITADNGLPKLMDYRYTTPESEEWAYYDDGKAERKTKSRVKERAREREVTYLRWKSSSNFLSALTH